MVRSAVAVTLLLTACAVGAAPASAQMYRWTDDQGSPHYSEGIDSVPERFRDRTIRVLPQRTTAPEETSLAGETVIEFTPGRPIYVTARINGTATARLILDTGADRTIITPAVLAVAGASAGATGTAGRIQSATGTADVLAYNIASLQVGNAKVGKMLVVSHQINLAGADGLLGRDFLDHFKVTLDHAASRVILGPR